MPAFEKVGECLYRYTPTGTYYGRFEVQGKEVRRSLRTTDRPLAKRRLADLQRDLARLDLKAGKVTLGEMVDRYLQTVQNQNPGTLRRKTDIASRLRRDFPGGVNVPISKVVSSKVLAWLASYPFGAPSYNHYLIFIRAVFAQAVEDKVLAESPIKNMKARKLDKPVRLTPTFEEFQAIVADLRAQREDFDPDDSGDFVEFIGLAGLGQAEASALRWGDVDWSRGEVTTFRLKTRQGFVIPLYPQLRPMLERVRAARGGQPAASERVFRIKAARKGIAAACRRLDLPAYTHRSFRRMFITRAIERGVDVKVIAEWQGHQDGGKLILDTYSQVRAKHSAKMAELMG